MTDAHADVPYLGAISPHCAPEHLALCARCFGRPAPALEGARVLELGCGMGRNVLALAYHRPEMTFVGVDRVEGYVAHAQAAAETLGLTNVRFVVGDLQALALDGPRFDFAIAHGVLSWCRTRRSAR